MEEVEVCKKSIVKCDKNRKQTYLEYPDGRKEYVGKKTTKI